MLSAEAIAVAADDLMRAVAVPPAVDVDLLLLQQLVGLEEVLDLDQPVRADLVEPLDVALVFSANPEDYTARGKIITPLKDRIGSEIRTHYPATLEEGIAITAQEAWTERDGHQLDTMCCLVFEFEGGRVKAGTEASAWCRSRAGKSNA